jgi:hypothetical protein
VPVTGLGVSRATVMRDCPQQTLAEIDSRPLEPDVAGIGPVSMAMPTLLMRYGWRIADRHPRPTAGVPALVTRIPRQSAHREVRESSGGCRGRKSCGHQDYEARACPSVHNTRGGPLCFGDSVPRRPRSTAVLSHPGPAHADDDRLRAGRPAPN